MVCKAQRLLLVSNVLRRRYMRVSRTEFMEMGSIIVPGGAKSLTGSWSRLLAGRFWFFIEKGSLIVLSGAKSLLGTWVVSLKSWNWMDSFTEKGSINVPWGAKSLTGSESSQLKGPLRRAVLSFQEVLNHWLVRGAVSLQASWMILHWEGQSNRSQWC